MGGRFHRAIDQQHRIYGRSFFGLLSSRLIDDIQYYLTLTPCLCFLSDETKRPRRPRLSRRALLLIRIVLEDHLRPTIDTATDTDADQKRILRDVRRGL